MFTYDGREFADSEGERLANGEFERIPRAEMPQITDLEALRHALFADFYDDAPTVQLWVAELKQRVNMDRVRERAIPDSALAEPIVVSADYFIIDGNHRFMLHKDRRVPEINAIVIPLDFDEAINWLAKQPAAERKGE